MGSTADPGAQLPFDRDAPLVGIEEEYLVIDPLTRDPAPYAAEVLRRAGRALGERASAEITRFQAEAKTEPSASADELAGQVRLMRARMAEAAREEGLALVASGLPVRGPAADPPITEGARYERGLAAYRSLHDEQSACAGHVHVHLPDREQAVLVGNHLRPWLPVLLAMSANSPFWAGRDTGHASWRAVCWGRWPVAGPPPYFRSFAHYEETVAALTGLGAVIDPGTLFWDVRPSSRLPTIEIRVADVPATAAESVLLALVVRALVLVFLDEVERGDRGPLVPAELLRAASWRAARDGLEGGVLDPVTGAVRPGRRVLESLLERIRPALERTGDLERVAGGLKRLGGTGSGAARQRASYARRHRTEDVVDDLVGRLLAD